MDENVILFNGIGFFLTGISTEMLHVLETFLSEDSTLKVNFIQSFLT